MKRNLTHFWLIALVSNLTACTAIQRFSTDKILPDASGTHTANLRVVTNIDLYAIPDSKCISLNKEIFAINKTPAKDPNHRMFTKSKFYKVDGKKINMKSSDIKRDMNLSDTPYVVQEYKIPAGKPITFFTKVEGEHLGAIFKKAFGTNFIPEVGRDYQILYQRNSKSYKIANRYMVDISYVSVLYELKDNSIELINNKMKKSFTCE